MEGAFLAFAAGDALGWPREFGGTGRARAVQPAPHVEFRTWTRRSGGRRRPFDEVVGAGEYSDDTQLLLVQDAGYLRRMAGRVAAGPAAAERLAVPARPGPRVVRSELAHTDAGGDVVFGGGMRVRIESLTDPKPIAMSSPAVRRWRLATAEGQTLYVTSVDDSSHGPRRNSAADALQPVQGALAVHCEPEPIDVSGLTYVPDFLDAGEETELVAAIDGAGWISELQRRVQHYGWRYDYKARQIDASMRLGPLPEWAARLARRLVSSRLLADPPDQVIVNEYVGNQGISRHVDAETSFADGIATISLLESWEMVFRERDEQRGRNVTLRLDPRSVAILAGDARYRWTHEIPKRKYEPGRVARGRRISLTFRKVLAPAGKACAAPTVAATHAVHAGTGKSTSSKG